MDTTTMKAAIYQNYGPPSNLHITHVIKPTPKPNELLIKIHATTVTSGDVRLRAFDFPPVFWLPARLLFGLCTPKKKILGHEFSGVVEAVGTKVTKFQVGQEVFGTTTMLKSGSYADYICLPQEWSMGVVHHKPVNMTFQQAAALPIGAMTAMYLLEKAKLSKNQDILIYGASGSVGSYAIQLAVEKGCTVTAVCSGKNFDMVQSLGAKHVLDYHLVNYYESDKKYDIVLDAVGKTSKAQANKVLKPSSGKFVSITMMTEERSSDLERIKELAERGDLKPFIDKKYPLEDIVKAHEYVDSGRKRGNVIITIHD